MGMIVSWLGARMAPLAAAVLALLLAWQSARINGWPFVGGGLKAQVSALRLQLAARDVEAAKTQAAMLAARQKLADAAQDAAADHARRDQAIQRQIQSVIREVPTHVSVQSDAGCVVPWGVVRLLDAAASGAGLDDVAAAIAPGQPDDAASDVKLSQAVALLAADLGIARQNAQQLTSLQQAVSP